MSTRKCVGGLAVVMWPAWALLATLIGCSGKPPQQPVPTASTASTASTTPAGSTAPTASTVSTAADAVQVLIKAVKPIDSKDDESAAGCVAIFQAIAPHLGDSSREMVDCLLAAVPDTRDHDIQAKKSLGAALEKAQNYTSAESALVMMVETGSPLAQIPLGAKAEIVQQTDKSPREVVFRVRWSKAEADKTQTFEETLVAVAEGGRWSVLLPLFGETEFGSGEKIGKKAEEYMRRKEQAWDAASMRKNNQDATKQLQEFRTMMGQLTRDLQSGKVKSVEAYMKAINR